MLNAGMTMNAVAMNIGCSPCAIRQFRQRFQATEHTDIAMTNAPNQAFLDFSITCLIFSIP